MTGKAKRASRENLHRVAFVAAFWGVILAAALWIPFGTSDAASSGSFQPSDIYKRMAPNYDLNVSRGSVSQRLATSQQVQALNNLKAATDAQNMTARWNNFGGSIDVAYGF